MTDQIVSALQQGMRGRVIGRDDADYDAVRALYNGMIDKRPRLIARCVDAADVIAAVNFGRDQGLLHRDSRRRPQRPGPRQLRRRPGDRPVDDEERARRSRRRRPCASSRAARRATSTTPRTRSASPCPSASSSTTGVAGLTLGGGTGYLTRKYGLTIDNLLEADVVLADGSVRDRQRAPASRSVLGAARRRRQLRRRHELPVPGASGEHGLRRADLLGRRRTRRR